MIFKIGRAILEHYMRQHNKIIEELFLKRNLKKINAHNDKSQ